MPKRSLEDAQTPAEGLDGEWVGRSVMLKPAAARGKRLPETLVEKICRVTRSGMIAQPAKPDHLGSIGQAVTKPAWRRPQASRQAQATEPAQNAEEPVSSAKPDPLCPAELA